jgi:peptidyl-prolyl cis-trans isomerase SurA
MRQGFSLFLKAMAAAFLVAAWLPAKAQESLRIAAIVNDEIVSAYDLESRIRLIIASTNLQETPELLDRLRPQALRNLIDDRLRLQEAKRAGITVSEEELARAVADIERMNGMPAGALYVYLERRGVDRSALANQLEAEAAWSKLMRARVYPRVHVGEEEIDTAMKRLEEAKNKPQFLVADIFLPIDSPADEEEAKAEAARLSAELNRGASFPALARNFSKGGTAAQGGSLGWVVEGQLPPEIDSVLRRLEPGQVSAPIRSLDGIHILHLRERRIGGEASGEAEPPPSAPPPRAAAQPPSAPIQDATLQLSQLVVALKEKASQAEIAAAAEKVHKMASGAKNCAEFEALGKKASPLSGPIGSVDLKDLPADLRSVLATLKANQISPPRRTVDGVSVVMVCSRKEKKGTIAVAPQAPTPSPAPAAKPAPRKKGEITRDSVRNSLIAEKMAVQARRYLRDIRQAAVVDMR